MGVGSGRQLGCRRGQAYVDLAGTCLIGGPGLIEQITVPAAVAESDRVFFLKITAKPGDVIRRPPDGNNILGFLCTSGATFDEAIRTAYEFAGQIEVRLAEPASRLTA